MEHFREMAERLVNDYSPILLNWAWKKVGNKEQAEDLVQDVWLHVFSAIRRNEERGAVVEKEEHLLWKVAQYVWYHRLRQITKSRRTIPLDSGDWHDPSDFALEFAESEENAQLVSLMRSRVLNLSTLQRELVVAYYLDGRSQKEIAVQHGLSVASVKWHLHNTRSKLKEELTTMKDTSFVYRPRSLHMAVNGNGGPSPDISMISNSLSMQNLCIACYRQPQTLDALCANLGIPKPYIESDLRWLVEREFLSETPQGYSTTFMIQNSRDEQARFALYLEHRTELSDAIVRGLIKAEPEIRAIGFHGSDLPMNKLLWLLIYRFCRYVQPPIPAAEPSIRPDGGCYFPLGFDRTDVDTAEKSVDTTGWAFNGGMNRDRFWWFGLYNFGESEIANLISFGSPEWQEYDRILCTLIDSGFRFTPSNESEEYALASLLQRGFIRKEGCRYLPNFCVFTAEQYECLRNSVFAPLAQEIRPALSRMVDALRELTRSCIPPQLQHLENHFLKMALSDLDYLTPIFAFNDGLLYVPTDLHDGEFLTLMHVRP